jgi:hypothetical protein
VASALLFAGCAVQNDPSSAPSSDTQISQGDLSKLGREFVATWNYDRSTTDTTKFYDQLTLKADATYEAHRSPVCPPGMFCALFVIQETGKWHVAGGDLVLRTSGGERNVFTASLSSDGFQLKLSNETGHALFRRNARAGESCGGHTITPISCEAGLVCFGPQQAWDAPGTCMAPLAAGESCGFRVQSAPCAEGLDCRWDGGPRDALTCAKPLPTTGDFCGGIAAIACPSGYQCALDGTYPDAGGHCEECPIPECAAPPPGCFYQSSPIPEGTCPTGCGKLVCDGSGL